MKDKYNILFNSMDQGFCIIEPLLENNGKAYDFRFLEVNPSFERHSGLKNAVGKTIREIIPEQAQYWIDIYAKVALTGKKIRFENEKIVLGRYFDVYAFPVDEPAKNHVAVLFYDITRRRKHEERQAFFLNFSDTLRPLQEPSGILKTAMELLGAHLGVNFALYAEVLPDGDTLVTPAGYFRDAPSLAGSVKISGLVPELRQLIIGRQTVVINDVSENPLFTEKGKAAFAYIRLRSGVGVPLLKEGNLQAILVICQSTPRRWTDDEIILFEEVAQRTRIAVERARAEEALRKSEECLNTLVNAPGYSLYRMTPDWTEMLELHGRGFIPDTTEPIAKWLDGYILPGDQPMVMDTIHRAIRNKTVFELEHRVIKADGSTGWTFSRAVPILDKDGSILEWFGVAADITARKEAEEALWKSEEKYRRLFNSIDEGFCIIEMLYDADGKPVDYRFLEVNQAFERQSGFKDAGGKTVREIIPAIEQHWIDIYGEVARTGKAIRFEEEVRATGSYYDEYAFRVDAGKKHVAVIFKDISTQKMAENALRVSEERLRLATRAGKAFSWELDIDSRQLSYAGDAIEVLGLSGENELPRNLRELMDIIDEEDRDRIKEELDLTGTRRDTPPIAFRVRRSQHETMWLEIHGRIYRDETGKALRIIGIAQDITRRREQEEALQRAREQAEVAVRAKDEFLSTMSHEIRTPLNAIVGLSSLLLSKNPLPHQLPNLNTLNFSARSLLRLVNDLLDFSMIERGKVELEQTDYSLSTLIRSIRESHTIKAEENDNRLYFRVSEEVPDILRGDPHKLAQVINNLIGNAIKFTRKGSISLEVSLEKQPGKEVWLHFAVKDTGIGISGEKLEIIFDKFTQADNSRVRRHGGMGLGLSITRSLLRLMGSEIHVESQEGKGSEFFFTIMQHRGDSDKLATGQGEVLPGATWLKIRPEANLLLVDDSAVNRMVLQQQIELLWPVKTGEASNGLEAIARAKQQKYDLILMDIRMPEMDGIEASRLIRELDAHYAKVPIIALTADNSLNKKDWCHQDLFNGIIIKPFDALQLSREISPYLIDASTESREAPEINHKNDASGTPGYQGNDSSVLSWQSLEIHPVNNPDFSRIDQLFGKSDESRQKLLAVAVNSLVDFRADFADALKRSDVSSLEGLIHKAKPLFIMFGQDQFFRQLTEICRQIDDCAPDPDFIEEAISKSSLYLDRLIGILKVAGPAP
jgi:PAS domain S-box-containing protein